MQEGSGCWLQGHRLLALCDEALAATRRYRLRRENEMIDQLLVEENSRVIKKLFRKVVKAPEVTREQLVARLKKEWKAGVDVWNYLSHPFRARDWCQGYEELAKRLQLTAQVKISDNVWISAEDLKTLLDGVSDEFKQQWLGQIPERL